jgi:Tfp pilus assembly protein PilF
MSQASLPPDYLQQSINELNLGSLKLPNSKCCIQKKSTAIISTSTLESVAFTLAEKHNNGNPAVYNYAQRYYRRAVDYIKLANWNLAVQELREAIKLEPNQSDYYALLGLVHFKQKFRGMARVYLRQALKLNPQNPLALKYISLLKITLTETTEPSSIAKAVGIAALLSRFAAKKVL